MGMLKVVAAKARTMNRTSRPTLTDSIWSDASSGVKISVGDPLFFYSGSGPSFLPQSGSRRAKSERIHADPDPQRCKNQNKMSSFGMLWISHKTGTRSFDGGRWTGRLEGSAVMFHAQFQFFRSGSALIRIDCAFLYRIWIRIGNADPGPGARKLTKNNKYTFLPAFQNWLFYLQKYLHVLWRYLQKVYFPCQNPFVCDGKVWPGSGSAYGSTLVWIRIRIRI